MDLTIAWSADQIGQELQFATVAEDPDQIRKINQRLEEASTVMKQWIQSVGGSVITQMGDKGSAILPAYRVTELEKVRIQFAQALGSHVSIGVGVKPSEATKALDVAKKRGGNRIVLYNPDIEKELKEKDTNLSGPAAELAASLHKAHPPAPPEMQQGEHSQGEAMENQMAEDNPSPEMTHAESQLADKFHSLANQGHAQDAREDAKKASTEKVDGIKQQVSQVLKAVQGQSQLIEQIGQQNPDLYQTLVGLIHSMIEMAKVITGKEPDQGGTPDPKVQKSEGQIVPLTKGSNKRLFPYNPEPDRESGFDALHGWQVDNNPEKRKQIPQMSANGLARALHKLHAATEVRKNAQGKREFLLHRGMGYGETHFVDNGVYNGDHFGISGWTPNKRIAEGYARGPQGHLVSAWVPEDAIHSIPKQVGRLFLYDPIQNKEMQGGKNEYAPEYEVMVKPTKLNVHGIMNKQQINAQYEKKQSVKKSEPLTKMALKDIPVGKKTYEDSLSSEHNYDHVLPEEYQGKLSLHVRTRYVPRLQSQRLTARLVNIPEIPWDPVGHVSGTINPNDKTFGIDYTNLNNNFHGQGLGKALYEALLAHALNHHGISKVTGDVHSSMASRAHASVARKHGYQFNDEPNPAEANRAPGPFDDKFNPYEYTLKSELQKNKPPVTFPKLGVPDDRRETPIVSLKQGQNKVKLIADHMLQTQRINPKPLGLTHDELYGKDIPAKMERQAVTHQTAMPRNMPFGASSAAPATVTSYAFSGDARQERLHRVPVDVANSPGYGTNSPLATKMHEDMHNIFQRVQKRYGETGRRNLALNLLKELKLHDRPAFGALNVYMDSRYPSAFANAIYTKPEDYDITKHGVPEEEYISTLLNYLNDPDERDKFHKFKGHDEPYRRSYDQDMKRAYRFIKHNAENADPKWVLNPEHFNNLASGFGVNGEMPMEKSINGDWREDPGYTFDLVHKPDRSGWGQGSYIMFANHNNKRIAHIAYKDHAHTAAAGDPEKAGYHFVFSGEVVPEHRGKGLYQELINRATQHVQSLGSAGLGTEAYQRSGSATRAWEKVATHSGMKTDHRKAPDYYKKDELEPGQFKPNVKPRLKLPVGTQVDDKGKVKVQHGNGAKGWIQARAGAFMGGDGHPLSVRNPHGK